MTKEKPKSDFDPLLDLRVVAGGTVDGHTSGARLLKLADGKNAWIPERLFIQVAPDATPETRNTPITTPKQEGEEGDLWEWTVWGNTSFETGRLVTIDGETNEEGEILIRSVTVIRHGGPLKSTDIDNLPIWKWAQEGLRQATGYLSTSVASGAVGEHTWAAGLKLGESVVEKIRLRPPAGKGRKIDSVAFHLAIELYISNKNPAEIRIALREQLGTERTERTIRRWIEKAKAEGEIDE